MIQKSMVIPVLFQVLEYAWNILEDIQWIEDYGVTKYSKIIFNLSMHGGSRNPNPNWTTSFKNALKGKVFAEVDQSQNMSCPYL